MLETRHHLGPGHGMMLSFILFDHGNLYLPMRIGAGGQEVEARWTELNGTVLMESEGCLGWGRGSWMCYG